jgi:hypothetical protein
VRVPRLDGARLGVLATRSPHRPCPIGLSVARIVEVSGRTLIVAGADIVDGSPVLDVKPYVPFCDAVPGATAPPWVRLQLCRLPRVCVRASMRACELLGSGRSREATRATAGKPWPLLGLTAPRRTQVAETADGGAEPLQVGEVCVPEDAERQLEASWRRLGERSLYRTFEAYLHLVLQALSRDIRSVTQRVKAPQRERSGRGALALQAAPSGGGADGAGGAPAEGHWHIMLEGVDITYDVADDMRVVVRTAMLPGGRSPGGAAGGSAAQQPPGEGGGRLAEQLA